jgi:hypothetical protein
MIVIKRRSFLPSRPVGLVVLKATLELTAIRRHTLIEIRRMCRSRRALLVSDGLHSTNLDTNRRLDDPIVAPNPHAGTGKRISYSYDSNKSYLSYQNIKSYISALNNSSLSDFLFVTITPY